MHEETNRRKNQCKRTILEENQHTLITNFCAANICIVKIMLLIWTPTPQNGLLQLSFSPIGHLI